MTQRERKAKALSAIAEEIEACRICRRGTHGQAVPGEGRADARIVFIGEAPGKQEAKTGRPFIGPAGRILRQAIRELGLQEEDVYITSPVKYLPKDGTPSLSQIAHGRTHMEAQLGVIHPDLIVLLGRVAALALLGRPVRLQQEHGTLVEQDNRRYFLMAHPAAQLYSPKMKEVWKKDVRRLKQAANTLTRKRGESVRG